MVFGFKKKFLFPALVFAWSTVTMGQNDTKDKYLMLTLAPLALLDIYDGASLRGGAEFRFNERLAVTFQGGTYLKYLNATKIDPEGYLVRPGIKYYLSKRKYQRYIALEWMHKEQSYDFLDKLIVDEVGVEKQYGMKRKINAVTVKYGKLVNLGSQWVLDWYVGLGIRRIDSQADLSSEEIEYIDSVGNDCTMQENLIRQRGNMIYPDLALGVKIGYELN
ncbi:DUF3575 domain-containing protein [Flavobacterium sp.]